MVNMNEGCNEMGGKRDETASVAKDTHLLRMSAIRDLADIQYK